MYRRKKQRKRNIVLLFLIMGAFIMVHEAKQSEVVQMVKESDINEFLDEKQEEVKKETSPNKSSDKKEKKIRVLIMGNGYRGEYHSEVRISSKGKLCVQSGTDKKYVKAEKDLVIQPDDKRFGKETIRISGEKKICIEHLERGYGTPSYSGVLELRSTPEGIVIINEIDVENYLKAVVPSEMPASYEMEALKAQAVCARSYAYKQMETYGYPEYKAHVNDSTEYQVYGNSKPQKSTNQAVKETEGQVVYYDGDIATTYFYSTSSGKTTDIEAWGTKNSKKYGYLQSVDVKGKKGDYEKDLPWYRWEAKIPVQTLSNLIGLNTKTDVGLIEQMEITKTGAGGVVTALKITGEKGEITLKKENVIRSALGGEGYQLVLNDGSQRDSMGMLPSAFFTIEKQEGVFVISGGGFGHGIGMSQNGANEMAKQGADYQEILALFYQDIEVR